MNVFEAWAIGILMGGGITGVMMMIFIEKVMDKAVKKRFEKMYEQCKDNNPFNFKGDR